MRDLCRVWNKNPKHTRSDVRKWEGRVGSNLLVDDLMLKLYMKNKSTINTKWIVGLYEINHKSFLHLDCLSRMLVLMTAGVFGWMNSQSWLENINLTYFLCFTINLGLFRRSPRVDDVGEGAVWSRLVSEISHFLNNF